MNPTDLFHENYAQTPYWHDGLKPATGLFPKPLSRFDVAIIGSGYTGLCAALQTARAGRSTLVLDAGDIGHGCSTRNGGQISSGIYQSLVNLSSKFGEARARAMHQEGQTALIWIEQLIKAETISCDFKRCGLFHAAHTPTHFKSMQDQAQVLCKTLNINTQVITAADQHSELGSDCYHGGLVFPRHASLDPAKYHRGLLNAAVKSGVHITPNCAVTAIHPTAKGFALATKGGTVQASNVIVATNGYTDPTFPWLRRRVIPIGSYIIATEPQPKTVMDELFPTDRVVTDSCKVVYYYRASPDRTRVLFGGRVSATETNPDVSAPKLHRDMRRVFPQLETAKISHSWTGTVAYTFDELPHIGCRDGVHYAMGYCGSGVALASYFGMRIGQQVVDLPEGKTPFDNLPFPTRPFYTGRPWFLPAVVSYYRARDAWQIKRAKSNALR